MKRSIKSLLGYTLKETDGEIGKVEEFYFDDQSWIIRYLIVKTGNWFSEKKVLLSPGVVQKSDWEHKEFFVSLTREQIVDSPDIDTEKPVSRQQEEQLSAYYPWEGYWETDSYAHGGGIFGMMPSELYESENIQSQNVDNDNPENNNSHLRSTKEVIGYHIHATDGEIGRVTDYIVDDTTWEIKFLVVMTGNWLDGRKVLLAIKWIQEVNWDNSVVIVNITTEAVNASPEFDPSQGVNDAYEHTLYDYYGRPLE